MLEIQNKGLLKVLKKFVLKAYIIDIDWIVRIQLLFSLLVNAGLLPADTNAHSHPHDTKQVVVCCLIVIVGMRWWKYNLKKNPCIFFS